ncbi:MAG TPA: ATP-binding cassette domain-containing protein [Desulfobacterales bacterium]|nr:ATP-binding cassette domain-containing protein [Desulfobacterales bacterium]HIP39848.1 ATP-binding cassette domain-containing protein [Desulfocapsa sulfexigens]
MKKQESSRVQLLNVVKSFGDNTVLHSIDLDIQAGSLTTLLGPSGCGKTTILRLIAGLELPTSGRVILGDEDVSVLSASQRDVAMVFQSYALFPHMTVGQNVGYGLKMQGIAKEERKERVKDALDSVGLDGFQDRYIDQMSGGQQQRVAVARALILEPKVMLFDEPLSNLDSKLRRQMREDIRRLQQELGVTSVYVTHDQDEALAVSDDVVVMRDGEIAQQGSPKQLYLQPNSKFVATFMGDANIIQGEVIEVGQKTILRIDDVEVETDRPMDAEHLGKNIEIAIRPEALSLTSAGDTSQPGLPCTITTKAYIGAAIEYSVKWRDQELFLISATGSQEFTIGEKASVLITPPGIAPIPGK